MLGASPRVARPANLERGIGQAAPGSVHIDGDPEKGMTVLAWMPQGSEHTEDPTTSVE